MLGTGIRPPFAFEPFPDLDEDRLAEYTEAFEALGFRRLKDYTTRTDLDNGITGFARLLVHPREHCFAEVNQAFLSGATAAPMRCMLVSRLEDGWSVTVSDRQPSKELYLMRRPRAVWRSLPREEPQGQTDEAGLVAQHALDRQVRLARVGRAKHGGHVADAMSDMAGHIEALWDRPA